METIDIAIKLDQKSMKRVQVMAKNEKRTVQDMASYLIERGVSLCELEGKIEHGDQKTNVPDES